MTHIDPPAALTACGSRSYSSRIASIKNPGAGAQGLNSPW